MKLTLTVRAFVVDDEGISYMKRRFFVVGFLIAASHAWGQALDDDFVLVPGGLRIHKSCGHDVPDGARVDGYKVYVGEELVAEYAPCPHKPRPVLPTIGGWAVSAEMDATLIGSVAWFNKIVTDFTVPSAPTNGSPQIVFMFPALYRNGDVILQPVLQWGYNRGIGGTYWTMVNYMVYLGGTFFKANWQAVSVGASIRASVEVNLGYPCPSSGSGCFWQVGYRINGGSLYATTWNATGPLHRAVNGALEGYNLIACNQWPASGATTFTLVSLTQAGPNASNFNPVTPNFAQQLTGYSPACGYSAAISGGTATLNY